MPQMRFCDVPIGHYVQFYRDGTLYKRVEVDPAFGTSEGAPPSLSYKMNGHTFPAFCQEDTISQVTVFTPEEIEPKLVAEKNIKSYNMIK